WPAATHGALDGKDTSFGPTASRWRTRHEEGPPRGRVEVTTFPASSTAAHSLMDGHETPNSNRPVSTRAMCHARVPPAGSVEVRTFPNPSTATQNGVDRQATAQEPRFAYGGRRSMRDGRV